MPHGDKLSRGERVASGSCARSARRVLRDVRSPTRAIPQPVPRGCGGRTEYARLSFAWPQRLVYYN